ncbi:hypothetical protein RhiirA1_479137 [Rhizophagus irregularis]|uniref:Uncharacterized protein n=2 Tax=Rhizophagus irregularis TaxID=588596 RepID=A0A2N0QR52_9GLOM|nr:hypothetical protein RhiirA1_479137 [Rhizophagus irregularis]
MNDDDIIGVDECNGENKNSDCTIDIDIDYDENINSFSNKRRACKVIVKEIWEINLKKDFLERNSIQEKKESLTIKYMLKVHGNSMCAKEFSGFVDENCQRDTSNNSNVWLTLANKAINSAFNNKPVFTRLCYVMVQAYLQKENGSGLQNLKYSEEFTNFLVILGSYSSQALNIFQQNLEGRAIQNIRRLRRNENDYLTDSDLCYENVARFKRLIDTLLLAL